jgi:hypothetical protein
MFGTAKEKRRDKSETLTGPLAKHVKSKEKETRRWKKFY